MSALDSPSLATILDPFASLPSSQWLRREALPALRQPREALDSLSARRAQVIALAQERMAAIASEYDQAAQRPSQQLLEYALGLFANPSKNYIPLLGTLTAIQDKLYRDAQGRMEKVVSEQQEQLDAIAKEEDREIQNLEKCTAVANEDLALILSQEAVQEKKQQEKYRAFKEEVRQQYQSLERAHALTLQQELEKQAADQKAAEKQHAHDERMKKLQLEQKKVQADIDAHHQEIAKLQRQHTVALDAQESRWTQSWQRERSKLEAGHTREIADLNRSKTAEIAAVTTEMEKLKQAQRRAIADLQGRLDQDVARLNGRITVLRETKSRIIQQKKELRTQLQRAKGTVYILTRKPKKKKSVHNDSGSESD